MASTQDTQTTPTPTLDAQLDVIVRSSTATDPVYTAAMGVAYAIQSCRVSGVVASALRSYDTEELDVLLTMIARDCPAIGYVPQWLNARYDQFEERFANGHGQLFA